MDIEAFMNYCLAKPGVTQSFPFGGDALVFKVMSKMFALTGIDTLPPAANLKCDPGYAEELRERFEDIKPGYHMSKKHWNTIQLEGNIGDKLIAELIDQSYDLVRKSLTKAERTALDGLDL